MAVGRRQGAAYGVFSWLALLTTGRELSLDPLFTLDELLVLGRPAGQAGWMTPGAIQADYADYSDSQGPMPTSVRLDPAVEARLESLARITGRSKAFYLRELIEQGLDDLEDAYLGASALEAHRRSGEAAIPLAVLMEDLGLED